MTWTVAGAFPFVTPKKYELCFSGLMGGTLSRVTALLGSGRSNRQVLEKCWSFQLPTNKFTGHVLRGGRGGCSIHIDLLLCLSILIWASVIWRLLVNCDLSTCVWGKDLWNNAHLYLLVLGWNKLKIGIQPTLLLSQFLSPAYCSCTCFWLDASKSNGLIV